MWWQKIAMGLAIPGILFIIGATYALICDFWTVEGVVTEHEITLVGEDLEGNPVEDAEPILLQLAQREEADEQILLQQQQILGAIAEFKQITLTRRGRAGIYSGGHDEEFLIINSRGAADMYVNFKAAKITINDTTMTLPIRGEIKGAVSGAMVLLSLKAARNFGITSETSGVILEPADRK
jgi:hypothetical protein